MALAAARLARLSMQYGAGAIGTTSRIAGKTGVAARSACTAGATVHAHMRTTAAMRIRTSSSRAGGDGYAPGSSRGAGAELFDILVFLGVGCAAGLGWLAWTGDGIAGMRRTREEDELFECKKHRLMTPQEAKATDPVRVPNFLSESELADLLARIREVTASNAVGTITRDPSGEMHGMGVWRTAYLHTDGVFAEKFADIKAKLLDAIIRVDAEHWQLLAGRDVSKVHLRTVEFHEYLPGGQLKERKHYDAGSLITCDIMLADPGADFEGGEFVADIDEDAMLQEFRQRDLVLFISHKYHNVRPVTKGKRAVLVAEIWEGPEKRCAHRCLSRDDACSYSLARHELASAGEHVNILG